MSLLSTDFILKINLLIVLIISFKIVLIECEVNDKYVTINLGPEHLNCALAADSTPVISIGHNLHNHSSDVIICDNRQNDSKVSNNLLKTNGNDSLKRTQTFPSNNNLGENYSKLFICSIIPLKSRKQCLSDLCSSPLKFERKCDKEISQLTSKSGVMFDWSQLSVNSSDSQLVIRNSNKSLVEFELILLIICLVMTFL